MTRRATHQRSHALSSRWVQEISCHRITTVYLAVATVIIIVLLLLF